MPVRHINGINVEYRSEQWDGIDRSGIKVVGKCILVLTDKCVKSAGGVSFDPQKEEQLNKDSIPDIEYHNLMTTALNHAS